MVLLAGETQATAFQNTFAFTVKTNIIFYRWESKCDNSVLCFKLVGQKTLLNGGLCRTGLKTTANRSCIFTN